MSYAHRQIRRRVKKKLLRKGRKSPGFADSEEDPRARNGLGGVWRELDVIRAGHD